MVRQSMIKVVALSLAIPVAGIAVPAYADGDGTTVAASDITTTTTIPVEPAQVSSPSSSSQPSAPTESTQPPAQTTQPSTPAVTTQPPAATTLPPTSSSTTQAPATVVTAPPAPEGTLDVIVTYKRGVDVENELEDLDPVEVDHVYEKVLNGAAVTVTKSELVELKTDPAVLRVETNTPVKAITASWGLDRIDQNSLPLSGTYGPRASGGGVRVYVLDTGVAPHAEFGSRRETGASVFGDGVTDCNGHGTHVAGTIAGASVGVAPGATVVPVRVLDCSGAGSVGATISGILWAVNDLASRPGTRGVINLSLGGPRSFSLNDAVNNAVARGMTVVVAAGNQKVNACNTSPASAVSAITVAATSSDDSHASFSNFGSCVDIYAPGVGIKSTWLGGGYATLSGTSMAAPHVAGAIAVLAAQQPTATASALTSLIISRATANAVKGIPSGPTSVNRLLCVPPQTAMTLSPTSLPLVMSGTSFSVPLAVSGAPGPYTWRLVAGALPSGISLSPTGVLSGLPTGAGTVTFTVGVANNSCQSATQQLTLTVVSPPVVATQSVPGATVNTAYSATIGASGGSTPYSWSFSGSLPPGLSLATDGRITGSPQSGGTFPFTVVVRDAKGATASRVLSITVNVPTPTTVFVPNVNSSNSKFKSVSKSRSRR